MAGWRRLRRALRRRADMLFPSEETRAYRAWISARIEQRRTRYPAALEPGLLAIVTPVWDGSPVRHLQTLGASIVAQNQTGACEWVIVDNGCTRRPLLDAIGELRRHGWVRVERLGVNRGILGGLRRGLESARARYVIPVDADDLLYEDALRIVTWSLRARDYPPLLYSDEDKVIGSGRGQPYMKPDWDPVLFLNSAYIAHLGALERQRALAVGAYTDPATEGSADWDVFMRFVLAGHAPEHIPEVLYSWRVHAQSTADDAAAKPYIETSQRAVLQRFVDAQPARELFSVERSPLLAGGAHWYVRGNRSSPDAFTPVIVGRDIGPQASASELAPIADRAAAQNGFVSFISQDVAISDPSWPAEALSVFDLHPDVAMIGGRVTTPEGVITEAGRHFGFAGVCGCPYRGRPASDPGYFGQLWKRRSVSAVSTQFAVVRASFLAQVAREAPAEASVAFLGAWAGAAVVAKGLRIAYSPFLAGVSRLDWEPLIDPQELELFARMHADIIPDRRFYSRNLSLERPFGFADPRLPEVS